MEFTEWLQQELESRQWSGSELARRAKVSQASVSLVLNGQRQPGTDFCDAVASAFRMSSEVVYRRAGLLPPAPKQDEKRQELVHLFEMMSEENRNDQLDYARMKLEKQEREDKNKKNGKTNRTSKDL